ncbi:DUF4099 domain-containing protein [Duncaniella muris]|uniref:DUF4099 domain-containing protein n=1 Tax=Duncaniella muris TaxID=2094150 RepID=UPI0027150024|nr:DUF4099 domain-containing protein [Duncaniella muris]
MENIQEQPEVLIARNNETGQVGAVVGQNPDGTPRMADAKTAKLSDLVKFNKHQNPLEAFMSNFLRQAKNPSLFGFFKIPADQFDKIGPAMSDMLQDPVANADLLKPFKVDKKAVSQTQSQTAQQEQKPATGIKQAPVNPDNIDWTTIEKQWGINRETLEQSGALQQMVYNHKSPQTFTLHPNFAGEQFEVDARLSFKQMPDGSFTLAPHFIKNEPQLDVPFKGYEFTKEDKEQLLKTGNLGKAVDLTDPKTGEVKKSLVSIDRLTNEVESVPVDRVYIKNHIGKTELSMKEIGILKDGGVVHGKEIELNNGRKFTSDLQYNADKRDVEFVRTQSLKQEQSGDNTQKEQRNTWVDAEGNPRRITKWKDAHFSEQQIADYMVGKKIEVANITDKKGQPCTVYLQFDKEKQRPVTEYKYTDNKKVVGVANESATQYAVNNQDKTNEATKNITDPIQKGQTAPKNEQQKAQQKKPKGPKI